MSSFLDCERHFKTAIPMGQCLSMPGICYEAHTFVSLTLAELSVLCLCLGACGRMSHRCLFSPSPSGHLKPWPLISPKRHPARQNTGKSVSPHVVLKVTFYLNMHAVCSPSTWTSWCPAAQKLKTCHSIRGPGLLKGGRTKRSQSEAGKMINSSLFKRKHAVITFQGEGSP